MGGEGLEVRLIGTVALLRDGQPLPVPGRRVRALLALLALSAGRTVSIEALAVGVWGDEPPERVRGSLQTYVGRLRRLVGAGVVSTQSSGYRLELARSEVDLLACADDAERAHGSAARRRALADVLERWREQPFGDPPSEWIARHEVPGWVERRLQVLERWVDLCFEADEHASCVVDLNREVERHPFRETLWIRLLDALDRSGRTAEALERYEEVRKRLAEELGVDPSPELRGVHARLLDRSDGDAPPRSALGVVPRQLPAPVAGFVGRTVQLDRLDAVSCGDEVSGSPGVVALHGLAGSGKTTLALYWAQGVTDRFPDGQLYLNLQGYGPGEPMDSGQALDALLRSLGVHGSQIPLELDARAALWRCEASGRRMLVLLDNAGDAEVVRTLLPGGACLVLVTSRNQLRSLAARDGARRVAVDPMTPDEAVELLSRRIGRPTSTDHLGELAEYCDHLPIALAVAAERVDREGHDRIAALSAQLRDRDSRLHALSMSEDDPLTNVRAVLESSYRALDDDTALAFRAVGMYADPRVSVAAVAALAGIEPADAERRLDRLVNQNLLKSLGEGWYQCHDLLRDLAIDLGFSQASPEVNADAIARLRNWFLHSTRNATRTISPPRTKGPDLAVDPAVTPATFPTEHAASDWLAYHSRYLLTVIEEANAEGDPNGYLLAVELFTHLNLQSRLGSMQTMYEQAERNARCAGDLLAEAECANCLGAVHSERRDHAATLACVLRARELFERAGEPTGVLKIDSNIALTLRRLGRVEEAIETYERLLDTSRRGGLATLYAIALGDVSESYLQIGRTDDAQVAASRAVDLLREQDNLRALAHALEYLGDAQLAARAPRDAVTSYAEACALLRRLGAATFEAAALRSLAIAHREAGSFAESRDAAIGAIGLLDRTGVEHTMEVTRSELVALLADLPTTRRDVREA
ncbi:MAG: BTAD domain-containing putative transcriptional regulator [Nocardioidaceae bacterium]